ncbi:holin family protein [Pseudobacillus sp. 179-B 2D1 NHS]|uniref:holin family protein n=1 Tax=Pseudobacillus sp. 179-B 2D1 NHS TaxID=3374292 RepID=UPI003879FBDD
MQHNTDTLWNSVWGGGTVAASYLFGGMDDLLLWLMIMMGIDYVTGIMAGINDRKLSSKLAFKGLAKKTAMLLMVIVGNGVDYIVGSDTHVARNAMILFLIGTEGISLIENAGKLGVTVPAQISKVFAQLKDENEEKAASIVEVTTKTEIKQIEEEKKEGLK